MLTVIDNFTLANLPGTIHKPGFTDQFFNLFTSPKNTPWREDSTHSQLLFNGTETIAGVRGIELRAQFRHRFGYILFTAYDYFDGEETYISFLDFDFKILDELILGRLFNQIGFAFDFEILSANEIGFSVYQEKKRRRLKINNLPKAKFPVSYAELTARSVCGHLSKHYLKLETE